MRDSAAYSDSINDLPLLESVGNPHAVNPDLALRRIARARGWPIHELRTRRRALLIGIPSALGGAAMFGAGLAVGLWLGRRPRADGVISRERSGDVAIVRLDAPPLNLLGSSMIAALDDAMIAVAVRAAAVCRAVLLGRRRRRPRDGRVRRSGRARQFITALHESCRTIRDLDAPVIAAIDGPCLGAHLEVAAACDLRIASARSRLGMPEIKVGIPSVIDAWWLFRSAAWVTPRRSSSTAR